MKKQIPFIIILTVVLILSVIIFFYLHKKRSSTTSAMQLIPPDAALIIRIPDITDLITLSWTENRIFKTIFSYPGLTACQAQVNYFDSLFNNNMFIRNMTEKKSVFLSFHPEGKENIAVLISVTVADPLTQARFVQFVSNSAGSRMSLKNYEQEKIYTIVHQNDSRDETVFTFCQGNLLMSNSKLLIEAALRQSTDQAPLPGAASLNRISKSAGQYSDANVYFNHSMQPGLFRNWIDPHFHPGLFSLSSLAGWTALDAKITDDAILFNGFSDAGDTLGNKYFSLFTSQSAADGEAEKILPGSTSWFIALILSDCNEYLSKYESYLQGLNHYPERKQKIEEMSRKYSVDPENLLDILLDHELITAHCNINGLSREQRQFTLLRLKSIPVALKQLKPLLNEQFNQQFSLTDRNGDEKVYTVYKFTEPQWLRILMGSILTDTKTEVFTIHDKYLLSAPSVAALKGYLVAYHNQGPIILNPGYRLMAENLSSQYNLFFYSGTNQPDSSISSVLSGPLLNFYTYNLKQQDKISAIALQCIASNAMMYNNWCISASSANTETPAINWQTPVDTTPLTKPAVVVNHVNHKNEIVIQDAANTLYLINSEGQVLWKKNISSPVNSDILQIDVFNNRKLQLLFSTKTHLYCLDRNGKVLDGYPVKLPADAASGITLTDYDNNKNYRILVPCTDQKIYCYDKTGKPVKGWQNYTASSTFNGPVQYFKITKFDYLLASTTTNTVLLNRKGEVRTVVEKPFVKSEKNIFYIDYQNDTAYFVTTTSKGELLFINEKGNGYIKKSITSLSAGHWFVLSDVDGDNEKEYIFADKNRLEVYTKEEEMILNYRLNKAISTLPQVFQFSATDKMIGLFSLAEQKAYLINNQGELLKSFPLSASTPLSIAKTDPNQLNYKIILGNKDNFLYTYIFNYQTKPSKP